MICKLFGHRPQVKEAGPLKWVFCLRCRDVLL